MTATTALTAPQVAFLKRCPRRYTWINKCQVNANTITSLEAQGFVVTRWIVTTTRRGYQREERQIRLSPKGRQIQDWILTAQHPPHFNYGVIKTWT